MTKDELNALPQEWVDEINHCNKCHFLLEMCKTMEHTQQEGMVAHLLKTHIDKEHPEIARVLMKHDDKEIPQLKDTLETLL